MLRSLCMSLSRTMSSPLPLQNRSCGAGSEHLLDVSFVFFQVSIHTYSSVSPSPRADGGIVVAEGPTPALLGPTGQGSRSNRPEAIAALPKPALRAGQNQGPSNAAKSLEKRTLISSTCARQQSYITNAFQECASLIMLASLQAPPDMRGTLGRVQQECASGASTKVVCPPAGSSKVSYLSAQEKLSLLC